MDSQTLWRTSIGLGVTLLLLGSAGCTKRPGQRLVGTWEAAFTDVSGLPDQAAAAADDLSLTLRFTPSGGLTYTATLEGEVRSDSGTWKLLRADGDTLTILTHKRDRDKSGQEVTVVFETANRCRLERESGDFMVLTRR